MPTRALVGGARGRRALGTLQPSAGDPHASRSRHHDKLHHRDAATKAPGGTNPSEDPTLRSSLQGLATRILADALNTEPGENGAEGADTAVREPSSEATMRRHTHTKAFAGSMTRVNARGAVLPGHVGRAAASTASSRARSATPSPERGRPGWRPNGAAAPSGHNARRSRTASPDVRACATAADKLVAAVSRQRERRAAARGLVFKDTSEQTRHSTNSSIAVQTDDDEAEEEEAMMTTTIDATLSESEDDGFDANAGILREFASGVQAVANEAAQQTTRVVSDDVDQCETDVWRAANSFARELRGVSASAAPIVAERLARSETDKRTFQLQVQEMKKRLETAVTFASEVRDVCATRDAELELKNAELSEARTALAAAAAGKLAAMLEPDSTSTDSNSNPQLAAEIAAAAKLAVVELEEELRATRSAHTTEKASLEREIDEGRAEASFAEESHQKTAHSLTKERDAARAALRDAEMETQEALSDVARLQKALAESKDANKSAADVAEAESKIVDELRGKLLGLETAKETLELKLKTAGAEANGEADMRADASADKRAARDDLATAKETIESLRHELDAANAARDKAERAKAEVNGKLFELTAEADGLRKRLGKAKEECEAQRNAAEAARRRAKASCRAEEPLRSELAASRESADELVAELASTRLQLAASERARKAAIRTAEEKDEECAGAKSDAMRLVDDVKRLESDLAKIGVSEKIREREALRALQEREWERGEAQTDHARVLREVGCRAEDAERECESLRKRVEDAEARADSAEVRSRDLATKIETLERSAKDSARASKGSSLTAEINSSLREELDALGLELATAREETESARAEVEAARETSAAEAAEVAKLSAALVRAETRASDAEARDAASVQTVTATRTELEAMAAKIAELELSAEAAFVERARTGKETERLEGELTEAETAKETLEGTIAALEEALAETNARLERAAAIAGDGSPSERSPSPIPKADESVTPGHSSSSARRERPAPIGADSSSSAEPSFPVTPTNDVTVAMAATAAAREEAANAEAQLEQIAEALVKAEVSLSEKDGECAALRAEVSVTRGKLAAAEHRAAVAEKGASAARCELGLALERMSKERVRADAAESQVSASRKLLVDASSKQRRMTEAAMTTPGAKTPGGGAGHTTTPATPGDELALRQRLRESVYEIELLRAKCRVLEAKAEVTEDLPGHEDESFSRSDTSGDADVSFEDGECAEAKAAASASTPEVSPMSRALGLTESGGEATPTFSEIGAEHTPLTTPLTPVNATCSDSGSFHGFTDPKLKKMLQDEEDGVVSPFMFPGWRNNGVQNVESVDS
jgi:chromosome segregation ATPase